MWAMGLLMNGIDSEDVIYMASNEDLHWQDIEKYFEKILAVIGEFFPRSAIEMCQILENKLLKRYENQEMTGVALVSECYQLWLRSGHDSRFRCWQDLDEDIYMCTTEHGAIFYDIDKNDIEKSIRNVLILENKVSQQVVAPEAALTSNESNHVIGPPPR